MANKLVPIDPALRTEAKALYLTHTPMNEIAKRLQVSTATLAKWRDKEGWVAEREREDDQLQADIVSSRKLKLAQIARAGIDQIARTVRAIEEDPEPMTIAAAEKLAMLLTALDKIHRLDNREATEHLAVNVNVQQRLSVDKIAEIIRADPFLMTAPKTTEE